MLVVELVRLGVGSAGHTTGSDTFSGSTLR